MSHLPPGEPPEVVQARLAAIVESSDDAIVSKTLEGVITSWNHGAERVFGWSAAEVVGEHITIIIPPDRREEEPQILARLAAGERVDHFETVRVRKDGRKIDVSVTISPVRDAAGRIVGASKIARDITAQKLYERELRAARDAADAARRDAEAASRAKDHFLSVLSHELRTPLTPALAAISLIDARAMSLAPQELRDHVQLIRRNVETQARLIDDLLDITGIARGKVELHQEVVDAHEAIRNVVAMLQPQIDAKALEVTLALRARDRYVWADPGRFQQILLNVLSNAVKFTPAVGTIAIRTTNDNGRGNGIRIEISDSGKGIDAEHLARLFEPFEQGEKALTRTFGGLGLGLAIVRSLVELHGGSITAFSRGAGEGASFTIRMQNVRPPEPIPDPAAPAAGLDGDERPLRILLVEDHDDTRQVLSLLLRSLGCDVRSAATVQEALQIAELHEFDLLLSDIGLPDGTGHDVLRQIRRLQPLRGIAISGYGQEEDRRKSAAAGFERHLIKPVSMTTLAELIGEIRRSKPR